MRPYEIMIIVDPTLDDGVIAATVDRTVGLVGTHGGASGRVERWGRRRLAYPINKRTDGYYAVIEATLPPDKVADLDRQLKLADEVIRHKVVQVSPDAAGRSLAAPPTYDEGGAPSARDDR